MASRPDINSERFYARYYPKCRWARPVQGLVPCVPFILGQTHFLDCCGIRRRQLIYSHDLYGKNFPFMVTRTRSPLGSSTFSICMEKSMALIMPSPNFSWIISFMVSP